MEQTKFEGIKQEKHTVATLMNDLIKENDLKSYLQIGSTLQTGHQIIINHKTSLDSKRKGNDGSGTFNLIYQMTSERYIDSYKNEPDKLYFDITFIDGDHKYEAVKNDLLAAFAVTNRFIVIRNAMPIIEDTTYWPNKHPQGFYHGDVYKLNVVFKGLLGVKLYSFDHGCLVIDLKEFDTTDFLNNVNDDFMNGNYTWEQYQDILKEMIEPRIAYNKHLGLDTKVLEEAIPKDSIKVKVISEDQIEEYKGQQRVYVIQEPKVVKKRKPMSDETKQKIRDAKNKKNKD